MKLAGWLVLLVVVTASLPVHAASKVNIDTAAEQALIQELAILFAVLGTTRTLEIYDHKQKFDSVLPIFKLEGSYQKLLTDVQGFHAAAELGMAFLGGDAEFTRLYESSPAKRDDIASVHGMFRMALIPEAGLNFAVGYKQFTGDIQNHALDVGAPLYLFPGKHWSIEAKPFISFVNSNDSIVYDLQGGLRYKYKLIGWKAGYRWIRIQSRTLQGPELAMVFEW